MTVTPVTIDGLPTLTINALGSYVGSVDGTNDLLAIYQNSSASTVNVSRNTFLNISSQPVGLSDSQTLTNKVLTSPTISSPTLSGTVTGTYTIGGTPTFPASVVTLTGSQTLTNKILTSPTINAPTITNATISTDAITGFTTSNTGTFFGISVATGVITTANSISGATLTTNSIPAGILQTNSVVGSNIASYRYPFQAIAANTTQTAAIVQMGWSYIQGTGANTGTKTITFPSGFTTILNVFVSSVGLASSLPTTIGSFTTGYTTNVAVLYPTSATTTNFVANYTLDSGATLSTSLYAGFSWIAVGT